MAKHVTRKPDKKVFILSEQKGGIEPPLDTSYYREWSNWDQKNLDDEWDRAEAEYLEQI